MNSCFLSLHGHETAVGICDEIEPWLRLKHVVFVDEESLAGLGTQADPGMGHEGVDLEWEVEND